MDGSYEFLFYFRMLKDAYNKFVLAIWALNAIIISIGIYAVALLLGIPAFTKFYWQDSFFLANLPAILSVILGAAASTLIRKRRESDLFVLLGPELSEKARTGYDNQEARSIPMESLAEDLKISLSSIKPSEILNWHQLRVKAALLVLLVAATIFIVQSQISADITPSDFQPISDLKDKALGLFQNVTHSQKASTNLSGNIYGKPSLAVLNETKLELELYPGLGAGSRARKTEPTEHLFQPSQPGEAKAVSSELYIESLPPKNKEIIKRYFTALSTSIT